MKKIIFTLIVLILLMAYSGFSQRPTIELTFSAQFQSQQVILDSIYIENLTQPGDTTLYAPNTALLLEYIVGIADNGETGKCSFSVSPSYPNPSVDGKTTIKVYIPEKQFVTLRIVDLFGREVTSFENTIEVGTHSFTFFSGREKHYVLSVTYRNEMQSIKILNSGNGDQLHGKLVYNGNSETPMLLKSQNATNGFGYSLGDHLRFIGYANTIMGVNGSDVIEATPMGNEEYLFEIIQGLPCSGLPNVLYEGQNYSTVKIGDQCWLKENLNVGTMIDASSNQTNNGTIEKYCYDNEAANCLIYGGLYQWDELMQYTTQQGAKGICPDDWHIPTDNEWTVLVNYFGGENLAGGKLKESGVNHWQNPNTGATNESGFTSLPGGNRFNDGTFDYIGFNKYGWSSTENDPDYALSRLMNYDDIIVNRIYSGKTNGFSVRCIKDQFNLPTVTTASITNITQTAATSGGTVTSDGGAAVTERGVCWSTSPNPTIAGNHTIDGSGIGTFVSNMTNLTGGILYYVRAYATNSIGTSYGNELVFTTLTFPTVTTAAVTNITQTTATCGGTVISDGGTTVLARGVCWSTTQNPTIAGNHTSDGNGTGVFVSNITGLAPNTLYYVRAYATNSVGTAYGNEVSFTSGQPLTTPIVTTTAVTNITQTTATSGGTVISDGGASVTERGVCWSTSPNPSTADNHTSDGTGTGTFVSNITGLSGGTFYYVRAFATNIIGTSYGNELIFTTLTIPTVTTTQITNITQTTATSGGTVVSDGGAMVTARGVCWDTSPNPTITGNHTNNGAGTGSFISNLTGLIAGTTYYVRAYAINSVGISYGNELFFTTLPVELPTVSTATITNISQTTATGGGNVTSDGGANVTSRGVCWSISQNPTINDNHTSDGSGTGTFVSNLTGLTGGTLYYVRAYATNSAGTSYGNELFFTTLTLPSVTTTSVTNITQTTAASGGTVTSDGGATVSARGVCWSTSPNPTISGNHTNDGTGVGPFVSNLTGLSAGTLYYIRAYAANIVGTSYGEELSFTTLSLTLPTVITTAVTNITQVSAVSGGNVTYNGGATVNARGVCWSTNQNPTIADNHTSNGSGNGTYVSILTNLTLNTQYYIRAYATNSVGTAYGNELIFTTLPWVCGTFIPINHVAGNVSPVNKTTTYGTVTNIPGEPTKCWITSNLGSDHQATSHNDATEASAGWYWQFNRKQGYKHDGTTRTPNSTWINSIQEDLNWQPENDPCSIIFGSGWRIPTSSEWSNVASSGNWNNWSGPWSSNLKLHAAGYLSSGTGSLSYRGTVGHYWSRTQYNFALGWSLFFSSVMCQVSDDYKTMGISQRCIRDGSSTVIPTVTTSSASNIQPNTATSGGNVTSDGGGAVVARGVCWSQAQSPTIADAHTLNGTGTGVFVSSLSGLLPSTVYYVRAYATNSVGTAYGNQVSFTTLAWSCGNTFAVTHVAGEVAPVNKTTTYGTVTNIGGEPSKCWITSNLGSDHQATSYDDATEASAGWYWQFNRKQGYKHDGVTRTPNTTWVTTINENSDWTTANDPCALELGNGWRIPTEEEWSNVTSGYGWNPWSSNLKIHAAGSLSSDTGSLSGQGLFLHNWSSTQNNSDFGWALFYYYSASVGSYYKPAGYPLRCIK